MDERNYVITRYFNDYGPDFNGGRLTYGLVDMINELKNKLHLGSLLTNNVRWANVRWIMTQETFIWLVSKCDGEYGFYYQVELSCTEPNKYSIMDIEVELVDNEHMRLSNFVKLSYNEDLWKIGAVKYVPWFEYKETREENLMKSFYVGCGKKVTIENVIFNNPATIVFWSDGTKTVVKRQRGDKKFDQEKGLAMAICKKVMGNKGNFNDIFKEWIEED